MAKSYIPAEHRLTAQCVTRYTKAEQKLIKDAARAKGLSIAAFIRETSLSFTKEQK